MNGEFTNEGIRISRICRFVREAPLAPAQRALADEIFAPERVELAAPAPPPQETTITVPVRITVRVGAP